LIEEKFEWICPRQECRKLITSYTEGGMRLFRDKHIDQHMNEDRAVEPQPIRKPEQKKLPPAPIVIKEQDYNILRLTSVDKGFLKTRGVRIDENCVLDHGD
jgi:hypothetical protein